MDEKHGPSPLYNLCVVLCIVAAFLAPAFLGVWSQPIEINSSSSDMREYRQRADDLVAGRVDPYHSMQPLGYSMLIAMLKKYQLGGLLTLSYLQVLMHGLSTILIWRAFRSHFGRLLSLLVLVAMTFHVPSILLTGFVMTETTFKFLLSIVVYLLMAFKAPWTRNQAFAIGLLVGFTTWFKGQGNFIFIALCLYWAASWYFRPSKRLRIAAATMFMTLGFALTPLSKYAFTSAYYGHGQFVEAGSSVALTFANCREKHIHDGDRYRYLHPPHKQNNMTEYRRYSRPFWDKEFYFKVGMDCILTRPDILRVRMQELSFLFFNNTMWPPCCVAGMGGITQAYEHVYSWVFFPGLLLFLLVFWRSPFRRRNIFFVVGLSIILSTLIFHGSIRYRVPFDVAFIPAAICGWSAAVSYLRKLFQWGPRHSGHREES